MSQGRGTQLLVGTTRNCLLTGDWTVLPRLVVRGHTDQVWAAAVHPGRPQFVTGAWDGQLVLWDVMTHSPVWELAVGVSWRGERRGRLVRLGAGCRGELERGKPTLSWLWE